jgi:hypothetical protein
MSGGHFSYKQYEISYITDEIERVLSNESENGEYELTPEVIEEFKKAIKILKMAYVYTKRIDWLLSGDDSEKTFFQRLEKELKEID